MLYILLGKVKTLLEWAVELLSKVEWMGDTPSDCYDYKCTYGAIKSYDFPLNMNLSNKTTCCCCCVMLVSYVIFLSNTIMLTPYQAFKCF